MEVLGNILDWATLQIVGWLWSIDPLRNTVLWSALVVWAAFLLYIALTHAKKVREERDGLGIFWNTIVYPVLVPFMVVDVLINLTIYSLVLLETPRPGEWTVTRRTQRLVDEQSLGWRYNVAVWFGHKLNYFDEHIRFPD